MVLLALLGAAAVWMLQAYDPGLFGGPRLGEASTSPPQPQSQLAAPAATLVYPPPGTGRPDGPQAAPPAPADPPPRAKAAPPEPTSPRQACGGRERYALLKCMETQCTKPAWTKHEQCVRLRKDRKL